MNIFILLLFFSLFEENISTIISKSNIEKCTKNESDSLNCTTKLVTTLSIENGKLSETDYMEVFISEVSDATQNPKRIENPYKITISKTAVKAEYPCVYIQDFNYKPVEEIIISDVFSCSDGDLSSNPTCGWVFKSSDLKTPIPYSQGFCCKCDFSQIVGIDTTSSTRGSSCSLFNLGSGSATAHCLRFNQLWYAAYEVKKYVINYQIEITVTYKNITDNQGNDTFVNDILTLSPSNTISVSGDKNVTAQLIGDFQLPTPPNDYSDYYLVMPSYPSTHSMVREGPLNWMLIPKNYFTLDGRECNKIGVSYYAFRSQGGASSGCTLKAGECLYNQIYDFYIEDIQRLSANKSPKYLLSQDKTLQYDFYSYSEENKKFAYILNGVFNTLITLEINADDIRFVTNVSNGVIDYVTIQTFEAQSNDGLLQTQITNSGSLTAKFYLSFNCSAYILPFLAEEISLTPFQSLIIKKDIYTFNQDFRLHSCNLTLKNAVGDVNDFKSTLFNTTIKISVNIQNPVMNNTSDSEPSVVTNTTTNSGYVVLDCQILCPEFFDFVCFFAHDCWGYFARTLSIMLVVVLIVIFILKMIKNGCCCNLVNKILKCFTEEENCKNTHTNNKIQYEV